MQPFLDSNKKPYIHLVDGGVADNLGLRAALERVTLLGDPWNTLKYTKMEDVHKIVFVVVNAETATSDKWDRFEKVPPFAAMLDSYSSIGIERYNMETVALLSESFPRWADEIRRGRCGSKPISTEAGSCGDIEFYLVQVRFDALDDDAERSILKHLPTSFVLKPEEVDKLRDAARRVLSESREFQRLLRDLKWRRLKKNVGNLIPTNVSILQGIEPNETHLHGPQAMAASGSQEKCRASLIRTCPFFRCQEQRLLMRRGKACLRVTFADRSVQPWRKSKRDEPFAHTHYHHRSSHGTGVDGHAIRRRPAAARWRNLRRGHPPRPRGRLWFYVVRHTEKPGVGKPRD